MTAPPERGKANAALEELVAALLGVPRARVRVAAGHTAREKVVEVDGMDTAEVEEQLDRAASG